MKIAYVTNYFYPVKGGVENHVYYLAKHMVAQGHDVTVLTSDASRTGRISTREEVMEGIKVIRFRTRFTIGDFGVVFPGVYRYLRKHTFDLINIHVYRHYHNLIPFFTKIPCVMTPHWPNYPKGIRKPWVDTLVNIFDALYGRIILSKYKRLYMVSGLEQEWFMKKFKVRKDKFTLTSNGIPSHYLKQRSSTSFRNKYKIKKNELLCVCLSRIHKSKGFDQVVQVAQNFPHVKFAFIGVDGGFRTTLESMIQEKQLNNVFFTGEVSEEEKLEALQAADIFIHPSHYEGFGIVVLEAFSQGCAVLTSDQGGLPWVVSDAGLIFQDNHPEHLKILLGQLVADEKLRKDLQQKGLERVKTFTWEHLAKNVEKLYEKEIKN